MSLLIVKVEHLRLFRMKKKMNSVVNFVILINSVFIAKSAGFYVTSHPVQESPQLNTLIQLVAGDIDYRFTDAVKRLTAIKDKRLKSCFISSYDPQWNLYRSDKEAIAQRNPYEVVRGNEDFMKLQKKAGKVIAHMCKRVKTFWMNQNQNAPPQIGLLPPPMRINSGNSQPLLRPSPLTEGSVDNVQAGSPDIINPPPLLPGPNPRPPNRQPSIADESVGSVTQVRTEEAHKAPPMIVLPDESDKAADENIATPPPLDIWRQMHSQNRPAHDSGLLAPPKLGADGHPALVEPPKIETEYKIPELHEPPKNNYQRPAEGLHPPPPLLQQQARRVTFKVPLPDFRTPPNPFINGHRPSS